MKKTFAYSFAAVGALALLVAGAQAGQWWAARHAPAPAGGVAGGPVAPDTIYRTRRLTETDTLWRTRPTEVVRYRTRTDTVRRCYGQPPEFDARGLVGAAPVQIEKGSFFSEPRATLTFFNPHPAADPAADPAGGPAGGPAADPRFEQHVYAVPEEAHALYPYLGIGRGPGGAQAGAGAVLRWRRVEAHLGYALAEGGSGLTGALRLRPFTLDW